MPKVSVLIPAYNHAQFIEDTVRSIWNQNYYPLEIVAADDASQDETLAILSRLAEISPIPMFVTRNTVNRGPAFTLNRAASIATGELFILFSSDDLLAPNRIKRQVRAITEDPSLYILFGNGYGFNDENYETLGICHPPDVADLLLKDAREIHQYLITHKNCIFVHTAIMRRSLFDAIGGYDEAMLAEDWSLNVRIFKYLASLPGKHHAFRNEHVFEYRLHRDQNFRNDKRQLESKWLVIEEYTPDNLKLQASNNIILEHLRAPWCRLCDAERSEQLAKLASFQASLGEWSSVLDICNQYISLYPDNKVLRLLETAARINIRSHVTSASL